MQLQETYKDSGLEIVGVAASEHAPTAEEARTEVEAWLADKFPNLNYRIAFDHTGEMNELWMTASLSFGIPTAFVVDRDGHIAFIGHAGQLDDVLPKVLNGSWRTSDEAKAADLERIAKGQHYARESALIKPITAKLWPAMQAEDWTTALAAAEELVAVAPDNLNFRRAHATLLLHKMRDMQTGLPVMRQLVRDAIGTKSEPWMAMAMELLFDPAKDNSHLPHAERFAMGKELAEQILVLNPPHGNGRKYASYAPVAQYYYEIGNKEHAIELVELGLNSVDHPEPMPDNLKSFYVPRLLQALANCTGEKACYGDFCVVPQNEAPETVKAQPPEEET